MESPATAGRSAITSSAQAPDLSERGLAAIPDGGTPTIIDFILPPRKGPLRVRRAAHNVDAEYLKKYEKAIELMKALPADDPRNFTRQLDLYHAYRDGALHQVGLPKLDLQPCSQFKHIQEPNSRFFFPWHRCYLYFHERILGNLIGDEKFSTPFWNIHHPERTVVPDFYNKNRDPHKQTHKQTPVIRDWDHDSNPNSSKRMEDSLKYMYQSMTLIGKSTGLFTGSTNEEGDETNYPGGGSVEQIPQWPARIWIKEPAKYNFEDMGNFYSNARDISFYGCCANVDRMWSAWDADGGFDPRDYEDPEWLEACFYFYDENRKIVRIKVRDCLDTEKLGYGYETVEIKK